MTSTWGRCSACGVETVLAAGRCVSCRREGVKVAYTSVEHASDRNVSVRTPRGRMKIRTPRGAPRAK